MTWNIWHGGKEDGEKIGPQKVIDVIKSSGVDLVAMQETYGSGELISEALGYHFHPRGTNVSIHSRYPIVEDLSVFEEFKCVGALVELPDKRQVAFYSIWLPYGAEIWEKGARDPKNLESMRQACQASCDDLLKMKAAIGTRLGDPKYKNVPVIIAGDFNSMSHLDYIEPFKEQFDGAVVDWATSKVLPTGGFRDSWRELHPEVDRKSDRTWTPRFPDQEQDRIDYIYYRGDDLEARSSKVIDSMPDSQFPSDHAALVTEFEWHNRLPSSKSMRVVSYNIKHGAGNDGRLDLGRTAALIKNLHADIVGLQEVDRGCKRSNGVDQPFFLAEKTQMHAAFGSFMDYDGGQYGLAILSRHPIESSHEIRLPNGNEPRVALACRIKILDGTIVTAVNLHFDWVQDDKFRFAQAEVLNEYLGSLKTPFVLLGDFNDSRGSKTLELLSANKLDAEKPAADYLTFSSVKPEKEIDFIFASPRSEWELRWCKVLNGRVTSDHRPVIAVLDLLGHSERDSN
ncbi:MAG: endonuclease/exonuclease/phosphatase family metal-dependent hydrolase [Planctomycetota bacterium]|jgi:endonuclease/exonuclease/phosphatase family metal-dependent hydrolase